MQTASVEDIRVHLFQIGRRCIDQLYIGVDEEFQQFGRHLIGTVGGVKKLREMDFVGIAGLVLDIATGTAHHHFLQYLVPKFLIDGIDTGGEETGAHRAALRHKALEFLDPRGKRVGNVADTVNRAARDILEQQQLVLDVLGRVVERRGRKQKHAFVPFHIAFIQPCRLADALQQVVVARTIMSKVMSFINNNKVIILLLIVAIPINNFIKTAVADKTAILVLDSEIPEGVLPVGFNRRREDDEDAGVVAIGGDKPLRNHGRHHGFAQTHHIGDKASAVPHHNVVPLHHSIALIGEVVVIVGKMRDEMVFDLIAEMVDEHPHIELVRRRLVFRRRKMSAVHDAVHVIHSHGYGVVPQMLKFLLAVMHIVIILHGHIQLIAWRFGGAEPLRAEVAAAHNDPAVAMLAVALRQAEIELRVEVFGGMDAQLQTSFGDVGAELADALIHIGSVFRLIDIAEEILAILFETRLPVAEKQFAGGLRLSEKIVDVDADEDADFADILQLLAQFEVAAGTKIANHGMEDVEVGHGGGDTVELVHQPRLDIVEKLGAHRLGVWGASPFERSQKRIRELLSEWRLWTA